MKQLLLFLIYFSLLLHADVVKQAEVSVTTNINLSQFFSELPNNKKFSEIIYEIDNNGKKQLEFFVADYVSPTLNIDQMFSISDHDFNGNFNGIFYGDYYFLSDNDDLETSNSTTNAIIYGFTLNNSMTINFDENNIETTSFSSIGNIPSVIKLGKISNRCYFTEKYNSINNTMTLTILSCPVIISAIDPMTLEYNSFESEFTNQSIIVPANDNEFDEATASLFLTSNLVSSQSGQTVGTFKLYLNGTFELKDTNGNPF